MHLFIQSTLTIQELCPSLSDKSHILHQDVKKLLRTDKWLPLIRNVLGNGRFPDMDRAYYFRDPYGNSEIIPFMDMVIGLPFSKLAEQIKQEKVQWIA